ncbi:unnamed protein product [Rhizophagus irregularis]|nr:unnamed protein product [Rhizophagus irregularis]
MPVQLPLIPIIPIDSDEARNVEVTLTLCRIFYQPSGYQRTAKKLYETSQNAGYDFTLDEVQDWLERQAVHQVHKPHPRFIPRVSFSSIQVPNEVHQADILYMPYDKVGYVTYLFCLNIVDIASRYKESVPIGSTSVKDRQGILTSHTIARAFEKVYDDTTCPLTWPKLLITDRGSEFKGECEKLMTSHGVKIQKAKSKHTVGIVERYNRTLVEKLFPSQDASDLLTLGKTRSRVWVKNLPIAVESINNSVTQQLGISPAVAIKKSRVSSRSSYPRDGPVGYEEEKLPPDISVRYLLEPNDLEGGRRRAGDMNWSPKIYHIHMSLTQKNQPVLYWLIDDDGKESERSFVREELLVIPDDTELPPQWVLMN